MTDKTVYERGLEVAKAICREACAMRGEPACWKLDEDNGEPFDVCEECEAGTQYHLAALTPTAMTGEAGELVRSLRAWDYPQSPCPVNANGIPLVRKAADLIEAQAAENMALQHDLSCYMTIANEELNRAEAAEAQAAGGDRDDG